MTFDKDSIEEFLDDMRNAVDWSQREKIKHEFLARIQEVEQLLMEKTVELATLKAKQNEIEYGGF